MSFYQQYFDYSQLSKSPDCQIGFSVILFMFWFTLYTIVDITLSFKSLKKKEQDDVKNRIVSLIHGIGSFWLAVAEVLPWPRHNEPNTDFQTFIVLFSVTYCVYDLIACVRYKLADTALYIHHLCAIMGFGAAIFSGYGAIDGIGGLFVAEVSNFWMHCRVILKIFDRKNTRLYELFENIYLFLYVLFRGILLPFVVWYPCMTSSNSPLVVKLMCTGISVQSYYFIWQMIGIVKRKQRKYRQMKQKNIQLQWIEELPEELEKLSFYKKKQSTTIF